MPTNNEIRVWHGNNASIIFDAKNSDGTSLNLTGAEIAFWVTGADGSVLIEKISPNNGLTITNAVSGTISLLLSKTEILAIPQGVIARYELERRIGGDEKTLSFGHIRVSSWSPANI